MLSGRLCQPLVVSIGVSERRLRILSPALHSVVLDDIALRVIIFCASCARD